MTQENGCKNGVPRAADVDCTVPVLARCREFESIPFPALTTGNADSGIGSVFPHTREPPHRAVSLYGRELNGQQPRKQRLTVVRVQLRVGPCIAAPVLQRGWDALLTVKTLIQTDSPKGAIAPFYNQLNIVAHCTTRTVGEIATTIINHYTEETPFTFFTQHNNNYCVTDDLKPCGGQCEPHENLEPVGEGEEQLPSQVLMGKMSKMDQLGTSLGPTWEHMGVVAIEVLGRSDQLTMIISFLVAPRQSIIFA
ncbi:hypothetical protein B0T20DRAFT_396349 [Sordaria brevicollis]|uniref:Uncharacterized protein n=1 Tax=Sordaria brevicollis TaxID=83679 RepID=A0AAE0P2A7_SORBR|nr:hypothetical protein B0T20DRAFT_396349 [Sordaria brevicollis]